MKCLALSILILCGCATSIRLNESEWPSPFMSCYVDTMLLAMMYQDGVDANAILYTPVILFDYPFSLTSDLLLLPVDGITSLIKKD